MLLDEFLFLRSRVGELFKVLLDEFFDNIDYLKQYFLPTRLMISFLFIDRLFCNEIKLKVCKT